MGTKQVRLDEDVYAKIADKKRDDESFSDAIDRLTDDWSLAEWGEKYATNADAVQEHLDTLGEIEETDREDLKETLQMLQDAGSE